MRQHIGVASWSPGPQQICGPRREPAGSPAAGSDALPYPQGGMPQPSAVPVASAGNREPLLVGLLLGGLALLLVVGLVVVVAIILLAQRADPATTGAAHGVLAGTPTAIPATPTPTVAPPPVAVMPTSTAASSTLKWSGPPTASSTSSPQSAPGPTGTVPSGWNVYRGTALPFVIAYPPDWTVDESEAARGVIYFRAPRQAVWLAISSDGRRNPGANIDVLRDELFQGVTRACEQAGIATTRYNSFSGILFASLAATCARGGTLEEYYLGAGLKDGVEWNVELHALYQDYEEQARTYFNPMLQTLNIYANP